MRYTGLLLLLLTTLPNSANAQQPRSERRTGCCKPYAVSDINPANIFEGHTNILELGGKFKIKRLFFRVGYRQRDHYEPLQPNRHSQKYAVASCGIWF